MDLNSQAPLLAEPPQRPTVHEVHLLLHQWQGVIVHFSGAPKGASGSTFHGQYPADLLNVLANNAQGGISCSVVKPGDDFHSFIANATGCIGVIVRMSNRHSLVGADCRDCGSTETEGKRTCRNAHLPLSIADVAHSLCGRASDGYNEWIVKDYEVIGLLVQEPWYVVAPGNATNIAELKLHFGDIDWYTLKPDGIWRLDGLTPVAKVSMDDLYPAPPLRLPQPVTTEPLSR